MPDEIQHLDDTTVYMCTSDGPVIQNERDATDVIGNGMFQGASWVIIPVDRLAADFFQLRTRLAGDIVQKFANYHLKLAIIGDISHYLDSGTALRDFVDESNRGKQLWFLPDIEAFSARIAPS